MSPAPAIQPHDHSTHDHGEPDQPTAVPVPGEGCASGADIAPLLGNLGRHQHPITTGCALAKRYFDEGLVLTYGFNHAEAIRSFQDGAKLDPDCAMCYWGIALALGPN